MYSDTLPAEQVRKHYEEYPYPHYPLFASVREADTYHLNISALWSFFNGKLPPPDADRILIAGSGTFSPYPFSVANPKTEIIALDLSEKSLKRARLHCLLHGRRNVKFEAGDLCNSNVAKGQYGLIDAFGVLHHLENPLAGLISLEKRLAPDGIIRVMLYSRCARREEESIRRALRLLKIRDLKMVRNLLRRSLPGSRFYNYATSSPEAAYDSGLADALLHPCVHTYRIDELMELVSGAGLSPLRFAHAGALADPHAELERLRTLELSRQSPGNFIVYLGRNNVKTDASINRFQGDSMIILNRALVKSVGCLTFKRNTVASRFGVNNPVLDSGERQYLRKFITPVSYVSLKDVERQKLRMYCDALFLLEYRRNH